MYINVSSYLKNNNDYIYIILCFYNPLEFLKKYIYYLYITFLFLLFHVLPYLKNRLTGGRSYRGLESRNGKTRESLATCRGSPGGA